MSRKSKIAVDLIGNNIGTVLVADLSQTPQFLRCPDTPDRIMRAAKDKQLYILLRYLTLKIFKINGIPAIVENQLIFHEFPVIVLDNTKERIINRRLDQYAVTRLSQRLYCHSQGKYNTRGFDQPLRLGLPPEAGAEPICDRFIIIVIEISACATVFLL